MLGMLHAFDHLKKRQTILRCLREYLHSEDFLELQAPCLVRGTCPDPYIESFRVGEHYLTTSTEYHIKRLMARGIPRLFTLQSNFRKGDLGTVHNPEFLMLEWGRSHANLRDIERDLEAMIARCALALYGSLDGARDALLMDLAPPFERLGVREALAKHLAVTVDAFTAPELFRGCQTAGVAVPAGCAGDATALFSLLIDRVSEDLGKTKPVWLVEWPAYLGSSVAITEDGTVDRSELFARGLEISDGFPFVNDAVSQRARFEAANRVRQDIGVPPVDFDERYLKDLPALPRGAGMAVGVDRLVMALLGATAISDVIAFPWDEL